MQEIVYHTNYELEGIYWWFVARNTIVLSVIENRAKVPHGASILDAGCGTGGFASHLSQLYKPVCLDTSATALEYCKKRGLTDLHNMTLDKFDPADKNIAAVTLLDVIEHIEDDSAAVKQAFDILPKGGKLIASVPAYMFLWSKHDEIHMHYRRYTKTQFTDLLINAGFEIEYSTYFNTFLFFPAVLKRFIDKITGADKKQTAPVEHVSPLMNKLFTKIFRYEAKLLSKISLPFGLSILTVAKKV